MELVGEGTYGKVYKAMLKSSTDSLQSQNQSGSPEEVKVNSEMKALKLLKFESQKEGFPITSLREILILKKLGHKNVVCLEDVFHVNRSSDSQV